ncbi:prolyl oligopeptidase family serine peptidase [Streptomyces sp. NPDC005483]|uniref:prolyl oligopeptidase family serine peptidase n=1 Tax=Streptomyces sp. NPDC005483 TaxID=3154882 RepID=UPI0033B80F71
MKRLLGRRQLGPLSARTSAGIGGYAVLHPNPRGSHGRGEAFTRSVIGDMLGAPVQDLLSGVDHLVDRGVADPTRIAVTGTSYGAVVSLFPAHRRPGSRAVRAAQVRRDSAE